MAVAREMDRDEHLAAVEKRIALGHDRHAERAKHVAARIPVQARQRLLQRAIDAGTVSQRVFWLRREAALVADAASGVAACKTGCAHCCHISVLVAEPEAKEIGRAIGRKPAAVPVDRFFTGAEALDEVDGGNAAATAKRDVVSQEALGVPCPFLIENRCSIYAHRPLACRFLFNLDDDDLLCRLVPGVTISVPYLSMQSEQVASVVAMGTNARLADIRDWFPLTSLQK